ncbi:MAG: hypothetical protein JWN04_694, partial [Myxococcaceae bacterium]|nr:hypothetical protein [Myxococcaceae bacterium]
MSARRLAYEACCACALAAVVLAACSSQHEVLTPLPSGAGPEPASDAGSGPALPRGDASLLADSASPVPTA